MDKDRQNCLFLKLPKSWWFKGRVYFKSIKNYQWFNGKWSPSIDTAFDPFIFSVDYKLEKLFAEESPLKPLCTVFLFAIQPAIILVKAR